MLTSQDELEMPVETQNEIICLVEPDAEIKKRKKGNKNLAAYFEAYVKFFKGKKCLWSLGESITNLNQYSSQGCQLVKYGKLLGPNSCYGTLLQDFGLTLIDITELQKVFISKAANGYFDSQKNIILLFKELKRIRKTIKALEVDFQSQDNKLKNNGAPQSEGISSTSRYIQICNLYLRKIEELKTQEEGLINQLSEYMADLLTYFKDGMIKLQTLKESSDRVLFPFIGSKRKVSAAKEKWIDQTIEIHSDNEMFDPWAAPNIDVIQVKKEPSRSGKAPDTLVLQKGMVLELVSQGNNGFWKGRVMSTSGPIEVAVTINPTSLEEPVQNEILSFNNY